MVSAEVHTAVIIQWNYCGGFRSNTGPGKMSQALLTNSIIYQYVSQHTHTSIIFSNVKHSLFILGTRWFISVWSIMSFFSSRTIFLTISISFMWFLKKNLWEKLFENYITGKKLTFGIKNLYNWTTTKNKLPSQKMEKRFWADISPKKICN